jgi:hypothetical protein
MKSHPYTRPALQALRVCTAISALCLHASTTADALDDAFPLSAAPDNLDFKQRVVAASVLLVSERCASLHDPPHTRLTAHAQLQTARCTELATGPCAHPHAHPFYLPTPHSRRFVRAPLDTSAPPPNASHPAALSRLLHNPLAKPPRANQVGAKLLNISVPLMLKLAVDALTSQVSSARPASRSCGHTRARQPIRTHRLPDPLVCLATRDSGGLPRDRSPWAPVPPVLLLLLTTCAALTTPLELPRLTTPLTTPLELPRAAMPPTGDPGHRGCGLGGSRRARHGACGGDGPGARGAVAGLGRGARRHGSVQRAAEHRVRQGATRE